MNKRLDKWAEEFNRRAQKEGRLAEPQEGIQVQFFRKTPRPPSLLKRVLKRIKIKLAKEKIK